MGWRAEQDGSWHGQVTTAQCCSHPPGGAETLQIGTSIRRSVCRLPHPATRMSAAQAGAAGSSLVQERQCRSLQGTCEGWGVNSIEMTLGGDVAHSLAGPPLGEERQLGRRRRGWRAVGRRPAPLWHSAHQPGPAGPAAPGAALPCAASSINRRWRLPAGSKGAVSRCKSSGLRLSACEPAGTAWLAGRRRALAVPGSCAL